MTSATLLRPDGGPNIQSAAPAGETLRAALAQRTGELSLHQVLHHRALAKLMTTHLTPC